MRVLLNICSCRHDQPCYDDRVSHEFVCRRLWSLLFNLSLIRDVDVSTSVSLIIGFCRAQNIPSPLSYLLNSLPIDVEFLHGFLHLCAANVTNSCTCIEYENAARWLCRSDTPQENEQPGRNRSKQEDGWKKEKEWSRGWKQVESEVVVVYGIMKIATKIMTIIRSEENAIEDARK